MIHHLGWHKRSEGHPGGVPLFGHYLARCLGAKEWSWQDFIGPRNCDEPEAARRLSATLHVRGVFAPGDTVVVDGFWGRGLPDAPPYKVVVVAHGTWRGIARALRSDNAAKLGDVQEREYRRFPVVAVSEATAQELRDLYGVEPAAVIRNGVDTEEFRPREKTPRDRPVVIYPSDAYPKGGDVVKALRERMPYVEFRLLGGEIGQEAERMAQGDVFLAPSRTEGCSYAALQALACGVPCCVSRTGMFTPFEYPGVRAVPCGASEESWEDRLREVIAGGAEWGSWARRLSEGCFSLPIWTAAWRTFLESL
jgi:glycosyltransferase involved in cell wall biosynthesis